MFVEEILKLQNNVVIEGTYVITDIKLKPFADKDGHFLVFNLQDKTGTVSCKIWDNAELIASQIKDQNISIVDIKGRTNIYNNKLQIIVEKIKKSEEYDVKNLIKISSNDPKQMREELVQILDSNLKDNDLRKIWQYFAESVLDKFCLWPGGKGAVHHTYQHGLLEHTLSVVNIVLNFKSRLNFNCEKAILGSFLHDIGKLEAYSYDSIKISMTDIGRLHEHTVLSYFMFRKAIETLDLINKNPIIEDVGHIILSHHGAKEQFAFIKPMTIEAKLVSWADFIDAESNHMNQQLEHNCDEHGWFFDTLYSQFFFKRPEQILQLKKRKIK